MPTCYTFPVSKKTYRNKWARIAFLAVVMTIAVTFGAMLHAYANGDRTTGNEATGVLQICVKKGDTLWSIAKRYAPEHTDIRSNIHQLKQANGLHGSMLHEGQLLIVP